MSDTPFEILGLPIAFNLNLDTLEEKYFQAQLRWHPDKFSTAPDMDKSHAEHMSAQINAGYKTLLDPIQRAKILLEIHGISVDTATAPPPVLEASMMHRMHLETLSTPADYEAFSIEIENHTKAQVATFEAHLGVDNNQSCDALMHLIYLDKTSQALQQKKTGRD